MGLLHRPIEFKGTDDEHRANRDSHDFITWQYSEDDAETRCGACDCRPSHVAANWPCGASVPREQLEVS